MTDENKKPDEDEVSDEQLEDVAGGMDVTAIRGGMILNTTGAVRGGGAAPGGVKSTFGEKLPDPNPLSS